MIVAMLLCGNTWIIQQTFRGMHHNLKFVKLGQTFDKMITFTPLSGAARSSRTVPLAYILQVDDVRILLDCGSPDWCPETKEHPWEEYCEALRQSVILIILFMAKFLTFVLHRCAPTIDLVLLSHGDLAHAGLYPYAYSRWGLKAPAYTTLPVQAMARIAATEDVEGIREEEDVGDDKSKQDEQDDSPMETADRNSERFESKIGRLNGKYVAALREVQDAFDSVNTLRYSQPTHLQGS